MDTEIIKALLIDDDQGDFQMTRAMLAQVQGAKIELDWVSTFEEGRDALFRNEYDVYLVDYSLEDRSGLDLLEEAARLNIAAPMIMLTGRGSLEVDVHAMRAGAADYLVKGFIDPGILERSIRYALARAEAQQSLRESETQLRSMFDHLPIGIYQNSPTGEFKDANPTLLRILGYPDPDTLQKVYAANFYLNPDDVQRFREELDQAGAVRSFRSRLKRHDGSTVWVRNMARAHWTADGTLAYIEGTVEDVTDFLDVKGLHDNAARFRALMECGIYGVATVNLDGVITETNQVFAESVGSHPQDLAGRVFTELFARDDQSAVREQFAHLLAGTEKCFTGQRQLIGQGGAPFLGHMSMLPIHNWEAQTDHILVILGQRTASGA